MIALIVYELMKKAIIVEGDDEWVLMMKVVVDVVDSV